MRRTTIIFDNDPETKHLWNSWEARKASISKNILKVEWPHGTLEIEAIDADLVGDMLFSHDSKAEIVKGKLGIQKVSYTERAKDGDLSERFAVLMRELLNKHDR